MRDRSPAAVARAFVERLRATTVSDPTPGDVEQAAAALVRAVRRECRREALGALDYSGCLSGAFARALVMDAFAALNRAPKKEARRG